MKFGLQKNQLITLLFCFICCFIVFLIYSHTLSYSWKNYDEHILYEETLLPIPGSFSEIFEIIKLFGLNNHFESTNPITSNISNIRGTPIDTLFCLFIFWLFKTSSFAYHAFSLVLHLFNTVFCFLILNKISFLYSKELSLKLRISFISLLTLIWALHPVHVETILFATNFGALVTYFFCFVFFFFYLNLINASNHEIKSPAFITSFILFFLYLFPLLLNEYSVTLPLILFIYLFSLNKITKVNITFISLIKKLSPLIFALILFVIYFFLRPEIRFIQENNFLATLERIFWLGPQIFFHYLKMLFFPITLTIDQSSLINISNNIFHPYSIFCSLFFFSLIFLSIISSILFRKNNFFYFFLVLFIPFFLSLLPFLHILSPLYNLVSERYLYLPCFFFIFGISHILFSFLNTQKKQVILISFLSFLVLLTSFRTITRTFDWKDSVTLLEKTIKTTSNSLYKSMREYMLASTIQNQKESEEHYKRGITFAEEAFKNYRLQEEKYQNKTPEVLKFYGLDPETLLLKSAFLKAYTEFKLNGDSKEAYEILSPHIKPSSYLPTVIMEFYYRTLFSTNRLNEAEELLNNLLKKNKICPPLFVALSDLTEYKYKSLDLTEKYLLKSLKYFPFDEATLYGLKRLYKNLKKPEKFAHYSLLYGLRTHDETSLQEGALMYIALNDKEKAKQIIKKLLKEKPYDMKNMGLIMYYKKRFGEQDV